MTNASKYHNLYTNPNPTQSPCPITIIILTEAHVPLASPLSHAHMVHHEQVDVQGIRACAPCTLQRCPTVLYKLNTTPLTFHYWWHVFYSGGVVERVMTPRVRPTVARETVNMVTSCKQKKLLKKIHICLSTHTCTH